MSTESTTGFHRQFPERGSLKDAWTMTQLREALHPFSCLADKLPEAIRPEETVTLEIKTGDLMLARKAYLEGM